MCQPLSVASLLVGVAPAHDRLWIRPQSMVAATNNCGIFRQNDNRRLGTAFAGSQ